MMIDPLSITAGIVTLLGAGERIGKFLRKVASLRNAPEILLAVNNEITDLRAVVLMFDDLLQRQYNRSDAAPYSQLSVILEKVKQTLLRLEQLVSYELTETEGDDLHVRLDKSSWLLAEPKFRAIKDQIRDDKTALYRGLALLTHFNSIEIENLSRRLYLSVETLEERMLQARDHVVEEVRVLGCAVETVLEQQKQQDHSLRRTEQDTAMLYQDGSTIDGFVFAGNNFVRKISDQDYAHHRLQHDVERTTTLYHQSGGIGFDESPIESGRLVLNADKHHTQAQFLEGKEQKLNRRDTGEMLHPATTPSSRPFDTFPLSANHSEQSHSSLPSDQLQSLTAPLQLTTSHCGSDCSCSCHRRSRFRSPSLLDNVLGSHSVGYHTSPWAAPTCNSPSCRHRSRKFTYTYAFPQRLCKRMLLAHLAYNQNEGPELCFRMLRVRSTDSDIFRLFRRPCRADEMIMTGVRRLFDNGEASVLDIDEEGASVLRWAVMKRCYRTIKLLIDYGADRHIEDSFGLSPFKYAWTLIFSNAVSSESAALLQQLFWDQSHFDIFQFPQLHKAYLGIAGVTFDTALASTQRPDVDEKDATGRTTLSWACQRGDCLAVSRLLERGANPNMSDLRGRTPLHWATQSSGIESMRLLLAAKADMELHDRDGRTPLALCSISIMCNVDSVKLLLDAKANIESQDLWLRRPLHHAAALNKPRVAKLLIGRGAEVDAESEEGFTAFEYAISRQSQTTTIKIALCPTDDAMKATLGKEILLLAALYGDEKTLKILLSVAIVDADLRAKDEEGWTALEIAEWRRDHTSTCSSDSIQSPNRDLIAWFETFKALWDDIKTRQEGILGNCSNDHVSAHAVLAEKVANGRGELREDEDDEVWEDATES